MLVFTCTYFCRFIHKIGQNPWFAKASKYRENKNFKNRERKGAKPQYNFLKVLDLHVRKRFNSQIVKSWPPCLNDTKQVLNSKIQPHPHPHHLINSKILDLFVLLCQFRYLLLMSITQLLSFLLLLLRLLVEFQ